MIGWGLLASILMSSSYIFFWLFGIGGWTWVVILIYKSPRTLLRRTGIPFPFNLNCLPCCVPAGILIFDLPPSIEGTSTEVPRAASVNEMGNS